MKTPVMQKKPLVLAIAAVTQYLTEHPTLTLKNLAAI